MNINNNKKRILVFICLFLFLFRIFTTLYQFEQNINNKPTSYVSEDGVLHIPYGCETKTEQQLNAAEKNLHLTTEMAISSIITNNTFLAGDVIIITFPLDIWFAITIEQTQ